MGLPVDEGRVERERLLRHDPSNESGRRVVVGDARPEKVQSPRLERERERAGAEVWPGLSDVAREEGRYRREKRRAFFQTRSPLCS